MYKYTSKRKPTGREEKVYDEKDRLVSLVVLIVPLHPAETCANVSRHDCEHGHV